ncbi:methionine adenosyltransferase [Microgenomates group bacterium RIFCSPLOWO2_01_FULL_46_13]|nr:MAG: methionine adenosyltransferase [Microgenomates group bacterium RIFCSPHIGHO2_01_FULL_45_11]OGV94460.1 MAG: methionine adenosyltransferase [Microgenomates group bacterium RIFCSPLOWO2_01_FULL_46_13]
MMITHFTSESVASGHPDKICDQISDAIVDAALTVDRFSRVAVETMVTKNLVVMAGEVTCPKKLNYRQIARQVIKRLGYTKEDYQFSYRSPIDVYIHQQSSDIAGGVDSGGAGDQGMMYGYATDETKMLMPLPIMLAHHLVKAMDKARETRRLPYLRPDGKAEVVVAYENGKPKRVETVVLAVPHDPAISNLELIEDLRKRVVDRALDFYNLSPKTYKLVVNGTGKWEIGGPASDTGVTGRKIIVDTYGSVARHGGGCFSGKDPTKVDRSGAYGCRYLAKNIVAHRLAARCEVRVAYVIGQAKPLMVAIETFGTERKKLSVINDFISKLLDMAVPNILEKLNLRRPIYQQTAVYGHFGNEKYPWERVVAI